jgi:hypothetical protein
MSTAEEKNTSDQWIRSYCAEESLDYDDLMSAARKITKGQHASYNTGDNQTDLHSDFWKHYYIATGMNSDFMPDDGEGSFFSCAC